LNKYTFLSFSIQNVVQPYIFIPDILLQSILICFLHFFLFFFLFHCFSPFLLLLFFSKLLVQIDEKFREMIISKLVPSLRRRKSVVGFVMKCINALPLDSDCMCIPLSKNRLDRKILEGLQLAQYEIFYRIQEDSWIPFSETDTFASLLQKKEVRTTLVLRRPQFHSVQSRSKMSDVSDNFMVITPRARRVSRFAVRRLKVAAQEEAAEAVLASVLCWALGNTAGTCGAVVITTAIVI
jgi:hypothetical protein